MSKREANFEQNEESRNVRQRPNIQPTTYESEVLSLLRTHPCKDNSRDNKCINNDNNPFGFRYFDTENCMDFSKYYFNYRKHDIKNNTFKNYCNENMKNRIDNELATSILKNREFVALQNARKQIMRESLSQFLTQMNDLISDYSSHNNEDNIFKR